MTAACSGARTGLTDAPHVPDETMTPTSTWSDLLKRTPYPFTTPLPPAYGTVLDGTYAKLEPAPISRTPRPQAGTWMYHPVRRDRVWLMPPAPYPSEGGEWVLHLDRGVFRVFHKPTGWRTLGSFSLNESQITIFNDPHCVDAVGLYTWELKAGQLFLEVIEDECGARAVFQSANNLRAKNLTGLPWVVATPQTD